MRPHCLVGKLPGCRERRASNGKRCNCEVKLLPVCLIAKGIGCENRQLGKKCKCPQAMLPICFALGCDDRKEGRACHCPRTCGDPCKCVLALFQRRLFAGMNYEQEASFLAWWIARLSDFDEYMEPEPPVPDVALTQEARLVLMEGRASLGLGLYHEQDIRSPRYGQEEELQERRRVDFMRLVMKGGNHGAA